MCLFLKKIKIVVPYSTHVMPVIYGNHGLENIYDGNVVVLHFLMYKYDVRNNIYFQNHILRVHLHTFGYSSKVICLYCSFLNIRNPSRKNENEKGEKDRFSMYAYSTLDWCAHSVNQLHCHT